MTSAPAINLNFTGHRPSMAEVMKHSIPGESVSRHNAKVFAKKKFVDPSCPVHQTCKHRKKRINKKWRKDYGYYYDYGDFRYYFQDSFEGWLSYWERLLGLSED